MGAWACRVDLIIPDKTQPASRPITPSGTNFNPSCMCIYCAPKRSLDSYRSKILDSFPGVYLNLILLRTNKSPLSRDKVILLPASSSGIVSHMLDIVYRRKAWLRNFLITIWMALCKEVHSAIIGLAIVKPRILVGNLVVAESEKGRGLILKLSDDAVGSLGLPD